MIDLVAFTVAFVLVPFAVLVIGLSDAREVKARVCETPDEDPREYAED